MLKKITFWTTFVAPMFNLKSGQICPPTPVCHIFYGSICKLSGIEVVDKVILRHFEENENYWVYDMV